MHLTQILGAPTGPRPVLSRTLLLVAAFAMGGPAAASMSQTNGAECGAGPANPEAADRTVDRFSLVDLPAGFRKLDSFKIDKFLTYDWDAFEIYLSSWHNGVQTTGDPELVTWNPDGSATLDFCGDGHSGQSGMLKLVRPTKAKGKWGAIVAVDKPDAVAAFFLYAKNGKEIDFELTRHDGVLGWAPNVWMPTKDGKKASRQGPPLHMPFSPGPQLLEVEFGADAAVFFVDGVEHARIEPDDMPSNTVWDVDTSVDVVFSVESHGPWAGQSYSDERASMTVYAVQP